jgi:hypothetical protein
MTTLDQIRESIDARIAELKQEITLLEAARAALHGKRRRRAEAAASGENAGERRRRRASRAASAASSEAGAHQGSAATGEAVAATGSEVPTTPADVPPKQRRRSRAKAARAEKPVEVLLAGKLESMLSEAEDGLSAIAISRRANAGYDQVLDLLRHLGRAGQVRRTGSRRTSLWRLITDEERIAERAAELESRSVAKATTPP